MALVDDEFVPYLLHGIGLGLAERLEKHGEAPASLRWMRKVAALPVEDRFRLVGMIEFFSGGQLGMEKEANPLGLGARALAYGQKIWPSFKGLGSAIDPATNIARTPGQQLLGRGIQAATIGFPAYSVYRYGQGEQGGLETLADVGAGLAVLPMLGVGRGLLRGIALPAGIHMGATMAGSAADRARGFKTRGERELGAYQQGAEAGIQQGMAQPQIQAQVQAPEYMPASSGLGAYDRSGQFHADPRYSIEAQMTERRFRDAVKSGQI